MYWKGIINVMGKGGRGQNKRFMIMNELNLRNPEFLKRIDILRWDGSGLRAIIEVESRMMKLDHQLYSKNGPLDDVQCWFDVDGRKIDTLAHLDKMINLWKQESNSLDIILDEYFKNNSKDE